ncbi:MAG: ChaN family lipoprotein [Thermoanaerobaculaceae bacterium]|nr:ChaN family lipoprotein [Thermoanaerobaculaceae bacterium]
MSQKKNGKLVGLNFYLKLLKSIKRSIREVQGPEDKEIKSYYRSYASYLEKCRPKETSMDEFLNSIRETRVLLVGDFHTLYQAQRQFLKILEFVEDQGIKPVVCLEMVFKKHQNILENLLKGNINSKDYIEKTDYFKTWGFDFVNYGKILDYLKAKQLQVYGINKNGSLEERDKFMAKDIAEARKKHSNEIIIALIGDLHIALSHLPRELSKLGLKSTILYQNSETVILRKLKNGEEPYSFFKIEKDIFLVNNTPPWIKMQSYLTYLEHGSESFFMRYGFARSDEDEEEIDYSSTVQNYIKALKDAFNLHNKPDDDFQIYTMEDLSFLENSFFKKEPGKTYAKIIKNDKSLFMTFENTIYTVFLDVNHTVEEAMHYLMGKDIPIEASESCFWERVHYFASGYIASKVINPIRQTLRQESLKEILERIEYAATEKDKRYLRRQIAVCMHVRQFFNYLKEGKLTKLSVSAFVQIDEDNLFELSRALGYQIGEAIFDDYNKGEISGRDIKHLVFTVEDHFEQCFLILQKMKNNFSCIN